MSVILPWILGKIHLLMTDSDNDEWFIWRHDEDRQVEIVIDISA